MTPTPAPDTELPLDMVIFGGVGDLAMRKLLPALYMAYLHGNLPGATRILATGRQDWAVHIALVEKGTPTHAAVGLPDLGVVFSSAESRMVTGPYAKKIAISHNRPPEVALHIAEQLGYETAAIGSAGAKAMHVLLGDYDAYIHAGGQYEWDSAAPVAVARGAGLHTSRLDGSPLEYNRENPWLPDLVVCAPELAPMLLEAIAAVEHEASHPDAKEEA